MKLHFKKGALSVLKAVCQEDTTTCIQQVINEFSSAVSRLPLQAHGETVVPVDDDVALKFKNLCTGLDMNNTECLLMATSAFMLLMLLDDLYKVEKLVNMYSTHASKLCSIGEEELEEICPFYCEDSCTLFDKYIMKLLKREVQVGRRYEDVVRTRRGELLKVIYTSRSLRVGETLVLLVRAQIPSLFLNTGIIVAMTRTQVDNICELKMMLAELRRRYCRIDQP